MAAGASGSRYQMESAGSAGESIRNRSIDQRDQPVIVSVHVGASCTSPEAMKHGGDGMAIINLETEAALQVSIRRTYWPG